jgi:glycosyltransferase involved in cell wall biosynthesis
VSKARPTVRVLLVADPQSPTTWGWVDAVRSADVIVLGADGFPWPEHRPVAEGREDSGWNARQKLRCLAGAMPGGSNLVRCIRLTIGPLLAPIRGRRIRRAVIRANPDIVHGLRIPSEAMAALAACPQDVPLAVSIWGNDLTHLALTSRLVGHATRKVLARADLLFADCQRDIDLARSWGLRPPTPTAVLPGGGGINLAVMAEEDHSLMSHLPKLLSPDHRLVVNARGARPYVRNGVLLDALSLLADDLDPDVRVVFADSAHDASLRRSIERHRLRSSIIVTGRLSHRDMMALLTQAQVSVSITDQDGTPNSLLESMAAGSIPVCSDLPSIREWIEPGRNGFLAAYDDAQGVACAIRLALTLNADTRKAIIAENSQTIAARAERSNTGKSAMRYYTLLQQHSGAAGIPSDPVAMVPVSERAAYGKI